MTLRALARLITELKREVRLRGSLLAAAFAPRRSPAAFAVQTESIDLIDALNEAGQTVGISAWDYDIAAGAFRFSRRTMERYGVVAEAASGDMRSLVERSVHPEDRARFRKEMVLALKGEQPLCISYRAIQTDGTVRPVTLRGAVSRGPNGRATRVVGFIVDMTPQEEASARMRADAEAQRKLLERLSLATEAAGIVIWDWDLATGTLATDATMAGIFAETELNKPTRAEDFINHLLHPEDRERFVATVQQAIEGSDDRLSTQFRYLRNDGSLHHAELHGRIVRDAHGRAQRLLFASWNVTANVNAQLELEKQSAAQRVLLERLHLATEVASIDVWDWDLRSDRLVAEAFLTDAYQTHKFDFTDVRRVLTQHMHPDDVSDYLTALDRALESGNTFFHRFRLRLPAGKQAHVEINARIFRDDSGRAVRLLGVSQNITEETEYLNELRRQAQEERALRDRLNLATRTAGIAIWDKDMVSGEFTCDEQFWKIFGLAPAPRFRVLEGIHPDERDQALEPLNAAFADPTRDEILSVRHRTSNPRPEPQYVQTHMRVFRGPDGKLTRLLGVTWDVTHEVLHTEQLKRTAEEERALSDRLNTIARAISISPYQFDLKTNRFNWYGLRQELFGLDHVPDEKYLEALHEIVVEEDRPKLTEVAKQAVADGVDQFSYDFRARCIDGQIHHMRTKCRMVRNAHGKFRYVFGVTMDVTQEVQANAELERRAEENRHLLDRLNFALQSANVAIWEIDLLAQRFVSIDNPIQAIGLEPHEYRSLEEYASRVLPEDRMAMPNAIRAALKDGSHRFSLRYRVAGRDGKIVHVNASGRVLLNEKLKPARVLGVSWDVTEEITASERYREQAANERRLVERLNVATQAAGISPWEFDLIDNRFSWFGELLPGYGFERADSGTYMHAIESVAIPEDRHILMDAPREAIAQNRDVYSCVYRARALDGSIHHLKNYARVLRSARGTPYRLIGVTWDVTEQVAHAEELQRNAAEQRAMLERLDVATSGAGIAVWEFDLKTNRHIWHGKRLGILGLDDVPLEDYFQALLNIVEPEDRHLMIDVPRAALQAGKETYSLRYRVRGVGGKLYYIQNYSRILRSQSGKPYRLVGVTWDVTEQFTHAEELQRNAAQQRDLLERLNVATHGAGVSLWEFDLKERRHALLSKSMPALGLDEVPIERYYDELQKRMHPDDRHLIYEIPKREIAAGSETYTYSFRAYGIDGELRHLQSYVRVLRSERGTPYRLVGVTRDATGEVNAALQLEEQARKERALTERFAIATQAAGISAWEVDLKERAFTFVENPLFSSPGWKDGRERLARFTARVHPEDKDNFRNAIRASMTSGSDIFGYRYRFARGDGTYSHVQSHARLYRDERGKPIKSVGVSWEVTKEIEAQEKLRSAERRLERASRSSSEGHWEADLTSGGLWFSASFHELLGFRPEEIEPRMESFVLLIHPNDRSAYREALRDHLAQNTLYDLEVRLLTGAGEHRWFRMRGAAERDATGKAVLIAGSIHDVHQQKLVEDALQLAQQRFERAINGTQDGLWELDAQTGEAWCSPRLALLLGYPSNELATSNFLRSLVHPEDAPKLEHTTVTHYRNNTPFDLELRLCTRGGNYRWYRARATAERGPNGRALRLSGSLQDVTEARAAREQLVRATEAAEAANRAKSAFLANMSHEIRTPMNGIIGMTGLLFDTELNRTQREYADTIRGSADSLLKIINDILDFSKIEAGKLDLEYVDFDLRLVVEDVAAMMAFQAASKGLELIVNMHPEVPERIKGDPQRLRQCLVNLVGNAIKFTKQGEIAIDVSAIGRHEGRVLTHFEVRDTGIGISEATLKTLFQPFVQADSSTTRHFGGTGLGLSIVRRLVEMMGGQAGVVSEVDKGSNFFFTLSVEPVDDAARPAPLAQQVSGPILIVDDNATNRRVVTLQLEYSGYRVIQAENGSEALNALRAELAKGKPIDLAITDYQMPDMDGAMLAARILAEPALANTRLIMLTSLDKQGDTQRLASLGFAAYLTKPIRRDELLTCVKRVLTGEARQWQMEIRPMITRSTLSQIDAQQRFVGHVLLVEDNEVNQKVATRVLERMGLTVRVAEHGAAGIAAFDTESFDLVLMDLQMPVMDGMTASRKIRELESIKGARRTPIAALTANALKGDRELCEAAGMDAYLTKPLELDRLRETLTRFGLASSAESHPAAVPNKNAPQPAPLALGPQAPPIDLGKLNELVDNDDDFLRELLETFLDSGAQQVDEIARAVQALDRHAIGRVAHKLKGGSANIHAIALRDLARDLEMGAVNADSAQLIALSKQLQAEFERAKQFLSDPSVMPVPIKRAS